MLVTVFFCNLDLHCNQNEPTATLPSTGSALSPWQHLPRTQLLVPPVPIGQGQARGVGFSLSAISSLLWGAKKRPIKKHRDGWGLGFRWPPFDNEKQQSTSSWRPRWDGCPRGGALGLVLVGRHSHIFWGNYSNDENIYMKYTVAFGWPLINNGSHNNQPKNMRPH